MKQSPRTGNESERSDNEVSCGDMEQRVVFGLILAIETNLLKNYRLIEIDSVETVGISVS
jgi:hypothetical protein